MTLAAIVGGPIVRRADETRISVWLATTIDPTPGIELRIFKEAVPAQSGFVRVPTTSTQRTIHIGDSLYVTLVSAYPDPAPSQQETFPKSILLAYELWFSRPPDRPVELKDLATYYKDLAYDGLEKPTFYLQSGARLVLAHGSCRKPHGHGEDAMPAADTLIGKEPRNIGSRPCMLCLTGDQIYANSVHHSTLVQIHKTLPFLLGYDEQIPTKDGLTSLKTLADVTRASKRRAIAKSGGLNPDEWPLFGLGEMLVMHLLTWHTSLWDGLEFGRSGGTIPQLLGFNNIKRFVESMPAVMRAMANAPVYMIFDDHEVTDDWNLYKQWTERVRTSDLGRRMVTNALVAYWLCQGWGNDPGRFDAAFEKQVQDYCDLLRTNKGKVATADARRFETFFWDFHDWGFFTPTTPPVFFLDTRTQRELYPKGRAPRLLTAEAWRSFLRETEVKGVPGFGIPSAKVHTRRGEPLVIVAPTPVFGMLFTEAMDKKDCLDDGPEGPDFEHWRFNQLAHYEFVKGLINKFEPGFGVFLSGDVHTAFSAVINYSLRPASIMANTPLGPKAGIGGTRFYQFTSSPLKNQNEDLGAQIDATKWPASEVMMILFGLDMWEDWDLVGYDRTWRQRVIQRLSKEGDLRKFPQDLQRALYVFAMDGQAPDDPFVTMTSLVATRLQDLKMGVPIWRETGRYFRHFKPDSDDAPIYPYNNIGYVLITQDLVEHHLCSVTSSARLMPAIKRLKFSERVTQS